MKALTIPGLLAILSCSTTETAAIRRPGLENAHRLTEKVLSGAQPDGDAAFAELAALGVKTVISVDGSKPDLESAHRHGLRYVHLPIGYDGIPRERALELAKAIEELPGPLYVHCHHGQHRGPAAAVVACVVAGRMTNEQALDAMKTLGTGPQYVGLWNSARDAAPADRSALRSLEVDFRETARVPPLAEAMVHLDEAFDRLDRCRTQGWAKPAGHPDLDPAHEALKCREICVELLRTEGFRARPDEFRALMEASRAASERLEALLRSGAPADAGFEALKKTCADCHRSYRNRPKQLRTPAFRN